LQDDKKEGKWIPIKNLDQLALPRIHRRIAERINEGM
jgi:hypothetical protein